MLVTLQNFDVTNADLFADAARTRIDLGQARDNTIAAIRGDFDLQMDWGPITAIEGGARFSKLEYTSFPQIRLEQNFDRSLIAAINQACRNSTVPESGFLSEPSNGKNLITNVDSSGNVIASGIGSSYATFDAMCMTRGLYAAMGGDLPGIPSPTQNTENVDVTEESVAVYLQANFESELAGYSMRGNFGISIVNPSVDSIGLRASFTAVNNPDGTISLVDNGDFESVTGGGNYTEVLPSVTLVVDLRDGVIFRGGVFRGLSRPDPSNLGFGRSIGVDSTDTATSVEELVAGQIEANGNPDMEPLLSWNYDLGLEWYPNDDKILAAAVYCYKRFWGGFKNVQRPEEFLIDGQTVVADVTVGATDDGTSTMKGLELSAAHRLSYLPGVLSGLGVKVSYNKAFSDFEFEDSDLGAATVLDSSGNIVFQRVGILPAADLFGFSDEVWSTQLYYQIGDLDVNLLWKHRSEYFQQFVSTLGFILYVDTADVYEFKIKYKLTDNIPMSIEAINFLDEPKTQLNPVFSNVSEVNIYGPRYIAGIKMKF